MRLKSNPIEFTFIQLVHQRDNTFMDNKSRHFFSSILSKYSIIFLRPKICMRQNCLLFYVLLWLDLIPERDFIFYYLHTKKKFYYIDFVFCFVCSRKKWLFFYIFGGLVRTALVQLHLKYPASMRAHVCLHMVLIDIIFESNSLKNT